jgi:CDP-diacylglycerol--glycerol-3-phosphate 3-phosphatidyltransferase
MPMNVPAPSLFSSSLMTNENVQLYAHDRLLAQTILRLIPSWIRPNHFTILRVCLVPVVLWFIWQDAWSIAAPLFFGTAVTDMIDGSLARTRKQITMWGTMADPIADKLLIGSVVIVFVAREINAAFAAVIVLLECLIVLMAFARRERGHPYVSANWYGKTKMVLQVAGVLMLLIARWLGIELFIPFSIGTLSVAIVFGVIS